MIQIKKLQGDIISLETELNSVQAIKKLLEEKYNTIQLLKKKFKVPNNQHVQFLELIALQEEK